MKNNLNSSGTVLQSKDESFQILHDLSAQVWSCTRQSRAYYYMGFPCHVKRGIVRCPRTSSGCPASPEHIVVEDSILSSVGHSFRCILTDVSAPMPPTTSPGSDSYDHLFVGQDHKITFAYPVIHHIFRFGNCPGNQIFCSELPCLTCKVQRDLAR